VSDSGVRTNRRTNLASVGAVASALAASSCCLPLFPFVAAAGLASGSALLATLRPYLLGASVLLIGYGFYQARRANQCSCPPNLVSTILLWSSAAIVVVMMIFPQAVAALLAG
jgi:mercuric ion transport protein